MRGVEEETTSGEGRVDDFEGGKAGAALEELVVEIVQGEKNETLLGLRELVESSALQFLHYSLRLRFAVSET